MKSTQRSIGHFTALAAILLAVTVSAFDFDVSNANFSASIDTNSSQRRLLAKPVVGKRAASANVALLASSSTTVRTSGKQGGSGKNSLRAVFETTKGAAKGTVMTARGFAVNKAKQLTLSASKGNKVKGSIAVSSRLSSTSKSHSQNLSMKMMLQRTGKGRRVSAVCDSVPILLTAYYTISCVQLNIVLNSVGLNASTTCVDPVGEQIFIASVQYNVSSNSSESYNLPASFNGFSTIDIELLNAACGSLVINNIDISVSAGVLSVAPLVKKWSTGQIVVALGNNKIDVRSKESQNTYDLGGKSSDIIKGIHRYNTYDNNEALIAVNLLVSKFSTFEIANIAVSSDGMHSVVDTFAIQDGNGTLVQPIKAICSFYDATCLIQVFRQSDSAILLLTFDVLDIVARSSTALPVPTDSIILEGALGGFVAADTDTIYYGSGDGITMVNTNSDSYNARMSVSAHVRHHEDDNAPAPSPGDMHSGSGIPFDGASNCSSVVLDYKLTLKGSFNRVANLLYTAVVACGQEVVEYNNVHITQRRGKSLTKDGSKWAELIDIDYSLRSVYNKVRADYIAVTDTGKVAVFKLGSMNEPNNLYSVTTTSGSAGVAVIELPVSSS